MVTKRDVPSWPTLRAPVKLTPEAALVAVAAVTCRTEDGVVMAGRDVLHTGEVVTEVPSEKVVANSEEVAVLVEDCNNEASVPPVD